MSERREPVVANLLTGFLGAGKTSLLNRLLSKPSLSDTAVLINEFGTVALDHLLVQSVNDNIVLLKSGCICCSIRTDLKDAILSLFDRLRRGQVRPFGRIVIETTGLADPVPIVATLSVDPMLKYHFRIGNIIAVVDVPNGSHNIETYPESARQVAVADRIIISKSDLANHGAIDRLRDVLTRINPAAEAVVLDEATDPAEALLLDTIHDLGARPAEVARRPPDLDELLNESLFLDLDHSRQLIGAWVTDYNTARPHSSLGYKTPVAYAEHLIAPTGAKPAEALVAAG